MSHKSGFVSIIGKPNAGKSTLLNALLGYDLSIVNSKAQTTRHRIKGIVNGENYQVVFSDTPGIIKPAYKLQERMMDAVEATFSDADLIIYIAEINDTKIDELLKDKLTVLHQPLFVVINKVDLADQEKVTAAMEHWQQLLKPVEVIPVSALHKFYIDTLLQKIIEVLPEGPVYYDKDDSLSDRDMRFFTSEIVREKILTLYQKEIPYSVEVHIQSYKEAEDMDRIEAVIFVTRESQKMILLGKGGTAIKKLGMESRKKLENLLQKKVYLGLTVKVADDWRNDDKALRKFGYEG